jgi:outer membrane protein Omp28
MTYIYGRITLLVLSILLLIPACTEDTPVDSNLPPEVEINFVAVRVLESGQHQLGVEFSAVDYDGLTDISFIVDGQNAATKALTACTALKAYTFETFINIDDPGATTHKVKISAFDIHGNEGFSREAAFTTLMRSNLIEVASSANCQPCAGSNEYYHTTLAGEVIQLRFATAKYHVWWPRPTDSLYRLTKQWGEARVKHYIPSNQDWIAPVAWVNGLRIQGTSSKWLSQAAIDSDLPPGADISLSKTDNGNTVELKIDITGVTTGQYSDLRLFTVITESEIHYNDGNSEDVHYDVMKEIIPDYSGEPVSIGTGTKQTFIKTIPVKQGEKKENMHVVVFLQSEGSREVLQSADIDLK